MFGVSSYIDEKFEKFAELLPHGSGIDCDWNAWESKHNVYFTNSYHIMNDVGFYMYWQDFSVIVPKNLIDLFNQYNRYTDDSYRKNLLQIIADSFNLQFNNGTRYLAEVTDLKDYLFQTIHESLSI